ncbi:SIR2 family protein [Chitinophagaceae bacterium IBVUCB1]|nr:SIR2 family protein [Chitinophagaceae bacterium IBVUCB1]
MSRDTLYKIIQECTNRVPLVVLGSGASIPWGLPSMWTLGEHLKSVVSFTDSDEKSQFEQFKTRFDACGDLELTLNDIQLRPNVLKEIVIKTWELVSNADLDAYNKIICRTEPIPLTELFSHFLQTAGRRVAVITTNYDRIAEYAAGIAEAYICNGFATNIIGHFSDLIHQNNFSNMRGFSGQVNIWKVHGSLDWYRTSSGVSVQLPMRSQVPNDHTPSIVTPGISKYYETHSEPYRTISAQADREIEAATGFLCIGYGFNDEHVQPKLITQIRNGKPIIVITKVLTEKIKSSIIGNNCKNYVLIEQDQNEPTGSRIYSSKLGELIIPDSDYWSLKSYLTIVKS